MGNIAFVCLLQTIVVFFWAFSTASLGRSMSNGPRGGVTFGAIIFTFIFSIIWGVAVASRSSHDYIGAILNSLAVSIIVFFPTFFIRLKAGR